MVGVKDQDLDPQDRVCWAEAVGWERTQGNLRQRQAYVALRLEADVVEPEEAEEAEETGFRTGHRQPHLALRLEEKVVEAKEVEVGAGYQQPHLALRLEAEVLEAEEVEAEEAGFGAGLMIGKEMFRLQASVEYHR